jgi:hypothetical protein
MVNQELPVPPTTTTTTELPATTTTTTASSSGPTSTPPAGPDPVAVEPSPVARPVGQRPVFTG